MIKKGQRVLESEAGKGGQRLHAKSMQREQHGKQAETRHQQHLRLLARCREGWKLKEKCCLYHDGLGQEGMRASFRWKRRVVLRAGEITGENFVPVTG
jgi:hypothetical protein